MRHSHSKEREETSSAEPPKETEKKPKKKREQSPAFKVIPEDDTDQNGGDADAPKMTTSFWGGAQNGDNAKE